MLAFDRRGVLALSTALPFAAGAAPALAQVVGASSSSGAVWDLTDLYPDWSAWDAARKGVLAALPRLSAYKGHLGDSAEAMTKAMTDISDVNKTAARVSVYTELSGDADLRNSSNQERRGQATDMFSALGEATSWLAPEVLALGKGRVEGFIAASPVLQEQRVEVERVLHEIHASEVTQILVFNKLDRLDVAQRPATRVDTLELDRGIRVKRVFVSALTGEGLDDLAVAIEQAFARTLQSVELLLPYSEGGRLAELHDVAGDLHRDDTPEGVHVVARLPAAIAERYQRFAV